MSEWWTYTVSDFLLFSPSTYFRLFELYNAAIWPLQLAAVALGLAIAVLLVRGKGARAIAAILATAWAWVAVAFLARRYATINWAAVYFAWAFGLEAALLAWIGFAGRIRAARPSFRARAGFAIFAAAIVVWPLAGPLWRGGWRRAETFALTPDPTAVGTLGALLALEVRRRWRLMILPVIWCVISGATLLAMKAPDAAVGPAAAVLACVLAVRQTRSARNP
jgi:hypothetical protein